MTTETATFLLRFLLLQTCATCKGLISWAENQGVPLTLCATAQGALQYHLRGGGLAWACARLPGIAVDRPCPHHGEPWSASLRITVPLLAQKVLKLVHQLLRVEVVVTPWARRLVPRRVIVLL